MSDLPPTNPVHRANRWLIRILAATVACNLFVFAFFLMRGDAPQRALDRTVWSVVPPLFKSAYSDDSWGPMGRAYLRTKSREDRDIYGIFFDEGTKFQYPPTSLLIFTIMPDSWLDHDNFDRSETVTKLAGGLLVFLRSASQLAVLLTIAASAAILEIGIRRLRPSENPAPGWRAARIGIALALGLAFYPVMKAHDLGQIQVYLNALVAVGILAHLSGWRASSGFCIGLACLFKPQLGLVVIWALLRRNWRVLSGACAAMVPLGLLSLALFGWDNHFRYLSVMSKIAKVGEAYWTNQCANGFINRLIGNGDPVNFLPDQFPPFHQGVYSVTLVTSLAIIGLALYQRRSGNRTRPTLDLAAVIAAATLASPIAWEHHYGAFLPLFALALPACLQLPGGSWKAGLVLGASFLAMGVAVLAPDFLFVPRSRGWSASHLFFGALLFFGLLLHLRRKTAGGSETPRSNEP